MKTRPINISFNHNQKSHLIHGFITDLKPLENPISLRYENFNHKNYEENRKINANQYVKEKTQQLLEIINCIHKNNLDFIFLQNYELMREKLFWPEHTNLFGTTHEWFKQMLQNAGWQMAFLYDPESTSTQTMLPILYNTKTLRLTKLYSRESDLWAAYDFKHCSGKAMTLVHVYLEAKHLDNTNYEKELSIFTYKNKQEGYLPIVIKTNAVNNTSVQFDCASPAMLTLFYHPIDTQPKAADTTNLLINEDEHIEFQNK